MGKHTVTLDEIIAAMDKDIELAASINAKTGKKKKLTFNPANLKYRVKFHEREMVTSNSYFDSLIAIEKYNSYDV